MLECPETVGVSLNRMLEELRRLGPVTHLLANRSPTPFQRSVGGRRYLAFDEAGSTPGVRILSRDFEDPWQRGLHEPALVAAHIAELCAR